MTVTRSTDASGHGQPVPESLDGPTREPFRRLGQHPEGQVDHQQRPALGGQFDRNDPGPAGDVDAAAAGRNQGGDGLGRGSGSFLAAARLVVAARFVVVVALIHPGFGHPVIVQSQVQ